MVCVSSPKPTSHPSFCPVNPVSGKNHGKTLEDEQGDRPHQDLWVFSVVRNRVAALKPGEERQARFPEPQAWLSYEEGWFSVQYVL